MNTEQTAPVEETTPETMDPALVLLKRIRSIEKAYPYFTRNAIAWAILMTEYPADQRHLFPVPDLH